MTEFSPKGPGFSTLWYARKRAALNRFKDVSSVQKTVWILGVIVALVLLLAAGHAAAPSLLIPPAQTTAPTGFAAKSSHVAGARALDAAFWLSLMVGAIFSFRVMELLCRREDIRRLSAFPLSMSALFCDRLVAGLSEALWWGGMLGVFFVPLMWHGGGWAALACLGVLVCAPLCTMCVGFGVQCFFGDAEFGMSAKEGRSKLSDGYGGAGSAFLFAPGVALALSVVVTLLLKLSFGELIRLEGINPATQAGIVLSLGVSAVALGISWVYFKRSYFRMLAGFREADFVGFEPPLDYQRSAFDTPRWAERLMRTPGARFVYRRHHLQYGRRFALTRYLYAALWIGFAIGLLQFPRVALPLWSAVAAVWVVMAVVLNPWRRLYAPGIATTATQCFALGEGEEARASQWFALREVAWVMAPPFALVVVAVGVWQGGAPLGQSTGLGGVLWLGSVAMWGAMAVSWKMLGAGGGIRSVVIPVGVALGLGSLLLASTWAACALALTLALAGGICMASRKDGRRDVQNQGSNA